MALNFAVLYSKKDWAGITISEQLKKLYLPQIPVIGLAKESIHNENIDEKDERLKNIDFIIFATKHQSSAKVPSLSLHAPGNWRNADFGGKPGKICKTSGLVLKFLFQKLFENSQGKYPITLECTHHGPLLERIPCCFIEIGSDETAWKSPELGKIIAKTIADVQHFDNWKNKAENKQIKTAIAIGGPHYAPNFNKIQLSETSNIAISHIIPEYALPLTENMLKEAIEKTSEHVDLVLLDWKGCGNSEERQKIIELVKKTGIPSERAERTIK